jgi:plasmid stabilization system protein ParE
LFIGAIREKITLISGTPELFSRKHKNFREVKVDHTFPYLIVYQADNNTQTVVISSIFHTSRKPKKKYRKL